MLKRLIEKLQSLTREPVAYDPSGLGDPIAMQTDWTPAKSGGASFRTHRLVEVNSFRMEFRASIGAIAFYVIFILIGMGVLVGFSISWFSSGASLDAGMMLPLMLPIFVGLVFAIAGSCMFYFGASPRVFDKRREIFWRGRTAPYGMRSTSGAKQSAGLDEIHALQLISEYCRSDKSSYYSYELNLVLEDSSRINVVDHGNLSALQKDARTLSAFLDKPIWDTTS